ncbi:MAG: nucleotide sugar dehydrogenase [Alphaproteobacteria bacterium]
MIEKDATPSAHAIEFHRRIASKEIVIGVMGLGYVGLPLVLSFANHGVRVIGYDVDQQKIKSLLAGKSYIQTIESEKVAEVIAGGRLDPTSDIERLEEADAILICVPTPLNRYREPDLSYVEDTVKSVVPHLRAGQMLSLESTTYPGTSREIILPYIEKAGFTAGKDFFLVYSPEREDPGNQTFNTSSTPKVVGGYDDESLKIGCSVYELIVERVVPVSGMETAEAVKLTENIFRAVNIALVNELKVTFDRMGIDVWDVIEAAKTKPFGYMPFYPGPGLGGHCIPIDPFYLTWKAREYGVSTRFIELSGEINNAMPSYVIGKLGEALDQRQKKGFNGSRILLVGLAYKKNVDDTRESPAFKLLDELLARGVNVEYLDPFVPVIPPIRKYPELANRKSVIMDDVADMNFDAALICTDHDKIDYQKLVDSVPVTVDTRNATQNVTENRDRIVKA